MQKIQNKIKKLERQIEELKQELVSLGDLRCETISECERLWSVGLSFQRNCVC